MDVAGTDVLARPVGALRRSGWGRYPRGRREGSVRHRQSGE